jgi:hypothetical protein
MRSHGVSDYPDPTEVGGGIRIAGSAPGMDSRSPAFQAAEDSCRHLLPNGGQPSHADQQHAVSEMRQSSRCMRAHGISEFPDPSLSPPADRSGYSDIMSNGVAWLAIPDSIDVHSPAVLHAAAACKLDLS